MKCFDSFPVNGTLPRTVKGSLKRDDSVSRDGTDDAERR